MPALGVDVDGQRKRIKARRDSGIFSCQRMWITHNGEFTRVRRRSLAHVRWNEGLSVMEVSHTYDQLEWPIRLDRGEVI